MLNADKLQCLDAFCEKVADLRDRAVVRNWPLKVSVDIFAIEATKVEGLDEDHFRAFLLALRQFILKKERTNFVSVCELLSGLCQVDNVQAWIAHSRKAWNEGLEASTGIDINGEVHTCEVLLSQLMYGGIVHSDRDKAALAKQDAAFKRMMLLQLSHRLLRPLFNMDSLIRCYREDRLSEVPPFP